MKLEKEMAMETKIDTLIAKYEKVINEMWDGDTSSVLDQIVNDLKLLKKESSCGN